jgi:general secretion pathway protein B
MSYILDALRRADSERERGAVPGVHAQPVPLGSAHAARAPAARTWVWVSVGLATVLVGLLAWQWVGRDAAPEPTVLPPAATTPPPLVAPVAMPLVTAPEPMPAPTPVPARIAEPAPVPAVPVAPGAARPRNAAPTPAKGVVAAAPANTRSAVAVLAASAALATAAARVPVPTASELPDDIQRGLPTLVVGGASYSQNPENRMLIVNGQVFREGDKVAPEVSLEQIRLKEAVLATKGYRYRIVY